MGKIRDPFLYGIVGETKGLKNAVQGRTAALTSQASILDFCGSDDRECREEKSQTQLIKRLGLNAIQYLPLIPSRIYGRSDRVPLLNLTGPLRNHIAYTAGNNVVVLDYIKDVQLILQGHKNKIVTLVKNKKNKFFASGDWGPRSTVIVWDLYSGNPYQSLSMEEAHPNGVVCLGFAASTQYVGVLGAEKCGEQKISLWSYDPHRNMTKPSCTVILPAKIGSQHEILFDHEKNEFFATTGHRGVAFFTWNRYEKKIACHVPKLPKMFLNRMKKFTTSVWSSDKSSFLTATMAGFVIIWEAPSPVGLVEPPDPNKNIKEFKRCYKIGNEGITCFMEHQGLYVIGDDTGIIRFYDLKFRLLYWIKYHKLPPIYFIAFNDLRHQPPDFQRAMRDRYDREQAPHIHKEKNSYIRDYTMGMSYYNDPLEATIERSPFYCSDFFVGVAHGNVFYYHIGEARMDLVVHGANSRFVACDINQVSNHLALVTYKGEIHLYDTKTHKMVCRKRLFKKPTRVSTLKFHPAGSFAFIGSLSGKIFYRRAFNFKPIDSPLDNSRTKIIKIIFSVDGLFMAYYDKSRAVGVYVNLPRKSSWMFKGKQRIHCKDIVDILFYLDKMKNENRFFSISADRHIIEYDIPNSSMSSGLKPLTVTRVDQFAVPRAMTLAEVFPNLKPQIVISSNNYKLSVYDPDDRLVRRTCQAPVYGTPINQMMLIKPDGRKPGGRVFTLFSCGNKLGLVKPPIDGNPYKYMAVLAHPSGVKTLTIAFDHKSITSIANNDTISIQWRPNIAAIESENVRGGSGIKPFLKMLDRDMPEGKSLVTECQNCFYMLMLQKISSTKELLTSELRILVKEIPSVVRFCGYFPTEYEIDLMIEEAEFAGVVECGERYDEIGFNEFIKLFANHRRFPPFTRITYANAFRKISKHAHGDASMRGFRFKRMLTTRGEKISDIDLPVYLPYFFRTIIHTVVDPLAVGKKERDMKKKKIVRKEIVDVIRGKSFLDHEYSRSVPLPLVWNKHDSNGKGKITAILQHLEKQKGINDNFPAIGATPED